MKMRIRLVAVLLSLLLCAMLGACAASLVSGEVRNLSDQTGLGAALSDSGQDAQEETKQETEPASGYEYRNEYFKIGCTLTEEWYAYTQDELNDLNGLVIDATEGTKSEDLIKQSLDNGSIAFDFFTVAGIGRYNINVVLGGMTSIMDAIASEKMLIDQSAGSLIETMEKSGIQHVTYQTEEITFLGKKHICLNFQGDYMGTPIYEKVVYLRRHPYLACITATSAEEDDTADMFSLFYSLD